MADKERAQLTISKSVLSKVRAQAKKERKVTHGPGAFGDELVLLGLQHKKNFNK